MSLDFSDWTGHDPSADQRPVMFRLVQMGTPFGLATILAGDGGQCPAGRQMVVTRSTRHGILLGGAIDDEIARRAMAALVEGKPGRRSLDFPSPVAGSLASGKNRIDVLVERVEPDDPALRDLERLTLLRQPALWSSDGRTRRCAATDRYATLPAGAGRAHVMFRPYQRLVVVGATAFAVAAAEFGVRLNWEVELIGAAQYELAAPIPGVSAINASPERFFQASPPDRWTAIVVATEDAGAELAALVPALKSHAGYVAVIGPPARSSERSGWLSASGLRPAAIRRLRVPVSRESGASGPSGVVQAVAEDIAALDRNEHAPLGGTDRTMGGQTKAERRQHAVSSSKSNGRDVRD